MKFKKSAILLCCFSIINCAYAKVLIFTYAYSRPEFLAMQHKTFSKFIKDDYELIVFSDAPNEVGHQAIVEACNLLGIRCIRIPQHIHEYPYYLPLNMPEIYRDTKKPSNVRHVHAVQYSLNTLGFEHDDIVVLIDNDAFLIRPLCISDFMRDCDIASFFKADDRHGATILYCCPTITFLNMKTLPDKRDINFNCGWVNGCSGDSGGFTHYYLKSHPELRLKTVHLLSSGNLCCTDRYFPNHNIHNTFLPPEQKISIWKSKGFNEKEIEFLLKNPDTIQFLCAETDCWFLHYCAGSNHEKLSQLYHLTKSNIINNFLSKILS